MIQQRNGDGELANGGSKTEQQYPADPLSRALRELRGAAEPFDEARFKAQFTAFYEAAKPVVDSIVTRCLWSPERRGELEDISQDFFVKMYDASKIRSYDPRVAGAGWVGRSIHNHVIDAVRRMQSCGRDMPSFTHLDSSRGDDLEGGLSASLPDRNAEQPLHSLIGAEFSGLFREAHDRTVGYLPERDARIWLLLQDGRSYLEIAKELDMNVGTVKSALFRIREKLREGIYKAGLAPEDYVRLSEESKGIEGSGFGATGTTRKTTLAS